MTKLRNGAEYIVEANQWGENGYKVINHKIVSYFIDRKDPQYSEGKGVTLEEFISRTECSESERNWALSIVVI